LLLLALLVLNWLFYFGKGKAFPGHQKMPNQNAIE
jgi:hypothetical protein